MARIIDKDTRLCMSLAGRPGNFGTRFHNFLYDDRLSSVKIRRMPTIAS